MMWGDQRDDMDWFDPGTAHSAGGAGMALSARPWWRVSHICSWPASPRRSRSIRAVCRAARPLLMNPPTRKKQARPAAAAVSNKATKTDRRIRSAKCQGTAADGGFHYWQHVTLYSNGQRVAQSPASQGLPTACPDANGCVQCQLKRIAGIVRISSKYLIFLHAASVVGCCNEGMLPGFATRTAASACRRLLRRSCR